MTTEELLAAARQFAYRLCSNHSDAEDIVQHVWLKLFKKYGVVDNKNLLFRAIKNHWFDQLRRTKVVSFTTMENAKEPSLSEHFGYSVDLESAMSQLSPREKDSLYMNVVEGYTAREIGEKLKIPRGTILCHLTRARNKLKEIFSAEFGRLPAPAN